LNNIVLNGIGATAGAKGKVQTFGIYIDDNSSGTKVSGNTIAYCRTAGIFVHNAHEIEIMNNTSYNNGNGDDAWCGQMLFSQTDKNSIIRNIVMRNNKFISKDSIQNCLSYLTIYDDADIIKFGTADSNYYARPIDDDKTIMTAVGQYWIITKRNLTNWKSYSNQDANSQKSPTSTINANNIIFEFNASETDKVISLNKSMIDVKGTKYQNSITLSPYTSIVLMVDPNPDQNVIPVYLSSAIENSTPNTLEMTYNLSLANIAPASSAFCVKVNSVARTVSKVTISGTAVLLTLASPVFKDDVVTISYTKFSNNPLQTAAGGTAENISNQPVTNNCITGIRYDANSEIIKLYPIPSDGHFSIDFIIPLQSEISEIVITDFACNRVYYGLLKGETNKQIDLSNLKAGIYVMMVINKKIVVTKKFIINR